MDTSEGTEEDGDERNRKVAGERTDGAGYGIAG
jgi:hypothetical protein